MNVIRNTCQRKYCRNFAPLTLWINTIENYWMIYTENPPSKLIRLINIDAIKLNCDELEKSSELMPLAVVKLYCLSKRIILMHGT